MDIIDLSNLSEIDKKTIFEIINVFKRKSYLENIVKELSKCI